MIRLANYFTILFFILFIPYSTANNGENQKLKKSHTQKVYSKFNINNISTYIYNDGDADIRPDGNSGFEYPKGSYMTAVFESGFVWGGKVNGKILVGGSTYEQGLQPGRILGNYQAEDPNNESVRVFRVRPDFRTANLSSEIADEYKPESKIRQQYEKDWDEWPGHRGAPYKDINNNGIFDPGIDIPGVPGADQTLWYVANDLDSNVAKSLYGSPSIGIEMQVTVWGYKNIQLLDNMIFKKYVIINKGNNNLEEAYISIWSDPDLGDASDDFVGCDTLLNLGFVYNGDDNDWTYGSENIPSLGFKLLQGPIVNSTPTDVGRFNGNYIKGKKNLNMTSFSFFIGGDPVFNDPDLGEYLTGSLQYYNLILGRIPTTGTPFKNPITNTNEVFTLSGDPVNGTGWIDGIIHAPGDRRMCMNSGPFTLAPGDTQEVIIAQIIAGGDKNTDQLEAVKLLKSYNSIAQEIYDFNFEFSDFNKNALTDVKVTEMDQEIILEWFEDENLNDVEHSQFLNYNFEGYIVYQYPNSKFVYSEAVPLAVFDLINGISSIPENHDLQIKEIKGKNNGLKRHLSIDIDHFNKERPIVNGTEYYFSVGTYSVNNDPLFFPRMLESNPIKFSAVPQSPNPGNLYNGEYGQKIIPTATIGNGNIPISIKVVNPTELTGDAYKLKFNINSELPDSLLERIEITIFDKDNNIIYDRTPIMLKDKIGRANSIYIDGFEIEPFDIKNYEWNPLQITEGDEFAFTTPNAIENDFLLAQKEVDKINVFPNPYYGKHSNELNQYEKFVTFNHLPKHATIRIFNLGGQLIHQIKKNDDSQFLRWDLTNGRNFWVPSGIYIVYIEMPELHKTKILKLAVILEEIIPDYF